MTAMRRFVPASFASACLVLAAFGGAGAAHAYEKLPHGLAKVTPAEVAERIRVEDEPLEPHIVVSTHQAWPRGRSIVGAHAADVHLRALVDRDSGAVRWQVWHELVYDRSPRHVVGVDYHDAGKPAQAELVVAQHWYDDCPATDAIHHACNRYARLAFELPGHVVEEIAAAYTHGSREPWRLSFKGRDGSTITGGLAPAEAAGLIDVVKKVRRDAGAVKR